MQTAPSKSRLLKPTAALEYRLPLWLRQHARWAPWRATWKEKKCKWDKAPVQVDNPRWGLSTARPELWGTFEDAMASYQKHCDILDGVGFCLTGLQGVVAVDLDKCSDAEGNPAPWAAQILEHAQVCGGYCERSPSGNGFRIFMQGESDDWVNHSKGIEVYAGNAARFVTVTGHVLTEGPL